jgi:cell division protein FtsB
VEENKELTSFKAKAGADLEAEHRRHVQALDEKNKKLNTHNTQLMENNQKLKTQESTMVAEMEKLRVGEGELRQQLEALQKQVQEMSANNQELEAQNKGLTETVEAVTAERDGLAAREDKRRRHLSQLLTKQKAKHLQTSQNKLSEQSSNESKAEDSHAPSPQPDAMHKPPQLSEPSQETAAEEEETDAAEAMPVVQAAPPRPETPTKLPPPAPIPGEAPIAPLPLPLPTPQVLLESGYEASCALALTSGEDTDVQNKKLTGSVELVKVKVEGDGLSREEKEEARLLAELGMVYLKTDKNKLSELSKGSPGAVGKPTQQLIEPSLQTAGAAAKVINWGRHRDDDDDAAGPGPGLIYQYGILPESWRPPEEPDSEPTPPTPAVHPQAQVDDAKVAHLNASGADEMDSAGTTEALQAQKRGSSFQHADDRQSAEAGEDSWGNGIDHGWPEDTQGRGRQAQTHDADAWESEHHDRPHAKAGHGAKAGKKRARANPAKGTHLEAGDLDQQDCFVPEPDHRGPHHNVPERTPQPAAESGEDYGHAFAAFASGHAKADPRPNDNEARRVQANGAIGIGAAYLDLEGGHDQQHSHSFPAPAKADRPAPRPRPWLILGAQPATEGKEESGHAFAATATAANARGSDHHAHAKAKAPKKPRRNQTGLIIQIANLAGQEFEGHRVFMAGAAAGAGFRFPHGDRRARRHEQRTAFPVGVGQRREDERQQGRGGVGTGQGNQSRRNPQGQGGQQQQQQQQQRHRHGGQGQGQGQGHYRGGYRTP